MATALFLLNCGSAYLMIGDAEAAERVLLNAANDEAISSQAHSSLTYLYSRQGRTAEALEQMGLSAESERDPARKAWLTGSVILASYPNDRTRLLEARSLFEEALRIQPGYADAKKSLEMVDSLLSQ
jgi:tetratricopeptide (TPR) repeat protein